MAPPTPYKNKCSLLHKSGPRWLQYKSIVHTMLKGREFPIDVGSFVPETIISPIIAPLRCKIYLFSLFHVNVYLPSSPPKPEAVIDALTKLGKKIS
jgi:hypothetical protein